MGTMESIRDAFREHRYITDRATEITLRLALELEKPLLVEGPAGVGKTEMAKVLADVLDTRLIRLQCYEGLDANTALYEWNYAKQMLHIRMMESEHAALEAKEKEIFSEAFLLRRPLLSALLMDDRAPVLLIDEIDRADEEFEAFLLEILGECQVTIPELGTIRAKFPPHVILTSNRSRELSDALRRRCLYQWIPFPDLDKEVRIIQTKLPGVPERLTRRIAEFMAQIRSLPLNKIPGVAESLDWARALSVLGQTELKKETVEQTLSCFLKHHEDVALVQKQLKSGALLGEEV